MGHSVFAVKGTGPNVWSYGTKQYAVFGNSADGHTFCQFDRATKALEGTLSLATIAGNPLGLPMTPDAHETPTVAVTPNGIVYVAGMNREATTPPANVIKTTGAVPGVNPLLAASWTDASGDFAGGGAGATFVYMSWSHFENDLVLIYRTRLDGVDPDNPGYERLYRHNGTSWSQVGDVIRGAAGTEYAFYRNQMFVEGPADPHPWRGHLFGAWDQHRISQFVSKFSYLYTDDAGTTWNNVEDIPLTTPFSYDDASSDLADTGVNFGDPATDNLYANGAAIDANGYPCGVYIDVLQARQRIVRWNGSAWVVDTSLDSRPGGGQLLNLVYHRGDLWTLMRPSFLGDSTKVELRRVAAPNEIVHVAGPVGSGWYAHYDPVALHLNDTIEMLHVNDDVPRIVTRGNHARRRAA